MSKKRNSELTYYDTHSFAKDFREAEKNGTLIIPLPGETAYDAIMRYAEAMKMASVEEESQLLRKVG